LHPFVLAAWRRLNAPLRKATLTVLRAFPLGDNSWRILIPAESLLCLRIYLSTDETRAVFVDELPLESETADLLAARDELRMPLIISTERFGDFELDRKLNWFNGSATWNGLDVPLRILTEDSDKFSKELPTACALFDDQAGWNRRFRAQIVNQLLELWNEDWRPDELPAFTPAMFLHLISLQSISIERNGSFQFCYDDGNLFGGHVILVRGNIETGKLDAHIAG
jgi:hypothetical protein